jgi:MazG family protein
MKAKPRAIDDLITVMATLRSPQGCPWDREQTHQTLRFHAIEEVYELLDAIEARDDHELQEELGDLLLQVVFHCQLASERGVFDFERVARRIVEKLIRRHPHVFGEGKARTVEAVWTEWEKIKQAEKHGTRHARPSALDGIPKHLPALLRAEKLVKKARRAGLMAAADQAMKAPSSRERAGSPSRGRRVTVKPRRSELGQQLFELAVYAQSRGWSAEELLRAETQKREQALRRREARIVER